MELGQALKVFAAATNNELFDPDYKNGTWLVDAVETFETLDHFIESSNTWNERSAQKSGDIAGFKFVSWKTVQPHKGESRRSVSVIDFGEVRYVIEANLDYF